MYINNHNNSSEIANVTDRTNYASSLNVSFLFNFIFVFSLVSESEY